MDKEKLRQKAKYAAAMREFFVAADSDQDGFINYDELKEALVDESTCQWLQLLGIEHTEMNALFHLLDSGDGYINFNELLACATRLGGPARASDQMTIICNRRTILERIVQLERELGF